MDRRARTVAHAVKHLLREGFDACFDAPPREHCYSRMTIDGRHARVFVGDGFLTFQVRRAGYVDGKWDPGIAIAPIRKHAKDRRLLVDWICELHAQAAKVSPPNLVAPW